MTADSGGEVARAGPVGVLQVITSNQRRGAETFAVDLDAELRARGIASELVALAPSRQASGRAKDTADVLDVPTLGPSPLKLSTLLALRRRATGAAVIVAHGSRTLPACVMALAGRSAPVVYRSIGDPVAWSGAGMRRVRTGVLLRRVAAVAALWPAAADALRTLHGVPDERLVVIPNGVPASRCPVPDAAARQAARASFGLPVDAEVVVCIGALSTEKRVGDAVLAVGQSPGMHLLVVGDGPERARLDACAAAEAPGRVHFAGVLDGPGAALAAADVVILPSRTEGLPGVLIEAGLSAMPAVATDVGGVTEIVRDGETGVVVAPGDVTALANGLRRALDRRQVMGAAARRHCLDNFEIGPVTDAWVTFATELGLAP